MVQGERLRIVEIEDIAEDVLKKKVDDVVKLAEDMELIIPVLSNNRDAERLCVLYERSLQKLIKELKDLKT